MSERPANQDDIIKRLLGPLERMRFDARFHDMLDMAAKAQAKLDEATDLHWSDVNDIMGELSAVWGFSDWDGTPIKVSGKLRLSGLSDAIGDVVPDGLQPREDRRGTYYYADNLTMTALGFTVDSSPERELDEYHPVVFSMTPVDEYDEDVTGEDGLYFMHPEDIALIEFREPSLQAAERNLQYFFPGIYKQVTKMIKEDAASDKSVVDGLKRLEITCDDPGRHGYDLIESLNLFIFSRINFDSMGYEITYDGPIGALTEGDDMVEVFPPDRRYGKLIPAHVCAVLMDRTDEGTYRPSLVVAVASPEVYGDFEAYVVPAESLMNIRNLRPRNSQLGNIALQTFEDPQDIAQYFSGRGALFVENEEGDSEGSDTAIRQFVEITEVLREDIPEIVAYDTQHEYYRVSIRDDLDRLACMYDQLTAETDGSGLDICRRMFASLHELRGLALGDTLVTHGAAVVIDTVGDEQESIAIEAHEFVRGTFCGFAISEVPDLAMRITGGEAGVTNRDLSLLIRDVEYVDVDGEVHAEMFQAAEIALPLPRDEEPAIFKVLRDSHD